MRTPDCPVAPATKTVFGSFLRGFPNDKGVDGWATAGTRDFTSGIFLPKSKKNRLLLLGSSEFELSSAPSSLLPIRKLNLAEMGEVDLGFLKERVERGAVVLRRKKLEAMSLKLSHTISLSHSSVFFFLGVRERWRGYEVEGRKREEGEEVG